MIFGLYNNQQDLDNFNREVLIDINYINDLNLYNFNIRVTNIDNDKRTLELYNFNDKSLFFNNLINESLPCLNKVNDDQFYINLIFYYILNNFIKDDMTYDKIIKIQ